MASVSSLYLQYARTPPCNSMSLIHTKLGTTRSKSKPKFHFNSDISSIFRLILSSGLTKFRTQSVICLKKNDSDIIKSSNCVVGEEEDYSKDTTNNNKSKRREALFQILFAAFSSPLMVSAASANNKVEVEEDFRIYSDDTNKFKIMIPQDWEVGAGQGNGIKSLTAFYPLVASDSNVSVLITGLGADFTRLESFGKVDAFAETLVSGLDRSWQRPPGVVAKLIDAKASKGFYYIEYTLQNPGESQRHIFSTIGMASNGYYNRLYTVTGQFVEEEAEKYRSKIEKSVSSFKFT